ncbi:Karyopherin transporter [Gonapodya sp. JEL0774]|nr:Karyopherin transporter [Gonapodya sp. JEL0774]
MRRTEAPGWFVNRGGWAWYGQLCMRGMDGTVAVRIGGVEWSEWNGTDAVQGVIRNAGIPQLHLRPAGAAPHIAPERADRASPRKPSAACPRLSSPLLVPPTSFHRPPRLALSLANHMLSSASSSVMSASTANGMEGVLDFSRELDISLLDSVVGTLYGPPGPNQQIASKILTEFQSHPDSWQRVDGILERSGNTMTKFLALSILENLVKTRWKILPVDQQQGIKNFVVSIIIKTSGEEINLTKERTYLAKLNMVLVQILKQEWPAKWPSFIPEIVASSKQNASLCENNMAILKLLSEEVFDFSAEQMTQSKTKTLKQQMCNEFAEVFSLCRDVLETATKVSLVRATLETLLRFLSWIPLGYIFETNIIQILRDRFLEVIIFRNITLKCLTEIASLSVPPEYTPKVVELYHAVTASIQKIIPAGAELDVIYESSATDDDQQFIQNVALFFTSVFHQHLKLLEANGDRAALLTGHGYLLRISKVKEREIFKICLVYWAKLSEELFNEARAAPFHPSSIPLLNLATSNGSNGAGQSRLQNYAELLRHLRAVMIERMVKPEEVLVVENDEGEIVREFVRESDTVQLYKDMKEVLVYLTHLDMEDMETIMIEKLNRQVDGSEWSWDNLNKLCWAIGSISGCMHEEMEKRFLVQVIKELLGLTEAKRGKDNKAVCASNIMYVVGQYPRFLKQHWKFLKTVVNKNFEFMHESHEGVQDMACDTFMKIATKCKRQFIMQQTGEVQAYIEDILTQIPEITSDLQPHQVHTFYEAVGHMISAETRKAVQERLIIKLMELPNVAWDTHIAHISQKREVLNEPEVIKILGNILKTNVAACTSIGGAFVVQLGRIYLEMLGLYKEASELISQQVAAQGLIAAKTPRVRGFRTIKKEVLKMIETYVMKADDLNQVATSMLPPLLEAVLLDYKHNVEPARDAEVLNVMAAIVSRLDVLILDRIPVILDALFECTLSMISKDFSEYPEHRSGFFKLIRAINQYCFQALCVLPAPQFKLIMDSIVWAFKHTMRDIAEIGLSTMSEIIDNFERADRSLSNAFFLAYFVSVLNDIFFVLTDTEHKAGFRFQTQVLQQLVRLIESNAIGAPLASGVPGFPNPNASNQEFFRQYLANLLATAFPHLQPNQIHGFIHGMETMYADPNTFKLHVRDFLIQLKEFSTADNADLFLDEKEAEAEAKKKADFEAKLLIPGMLKPSERPEDGMMD